MSVCVWVCVCVCVCVVSFRLGQRHDDTDDSVAASTDYGRRAGKKNHISVAASLTRRSS